MAKTKVQITMDEELLQNLDDYCDKNYMNRSWVISQAVLQVINQQKLIDAITSVSIAVKKSAETGVLDEHTQKELEAFEALSKMMLGK